MAQRRMFAKSVVQSDLFLEMPLTTQAVYFHLGMDADDDGFLINAKSVCRLINASEDDIKLLIAKGFLIKFRKGIVVIRDWKQNNYIQNDRYHETVCFAEKQQLVCGKNGQYELMDTKCIQNVSNLYPQDRLELGNNYIKNSNRNKDRFNNSIIFPKGNYNKNVVAVFEKFGIDKSKWEELSTYTEQRILDVAAVVNSKKNVQNPSGLFISMLENNWALPVSNEEMNAKKKEELQRYKKRASDFCLSCNKQNENEDLICSHDGMRLDRDTLKNVKCEYCEVV